MCGALAWREHTIRGFGGKLFPKKALRSGGKLSYQYRMATPGTPKTAAEKEEFSGPADLLALAHKAADPAGSLIDGRWKVATRGAWSRYVCAALQEKMIRDGQWPTTENEIKARIMGTAEEIGLQKSLDGLRGMLRHTPDATAKAVEAA